MAFRFEQLIIWQKAVELYNHIFEVTEKFPQSELFGLTSQIRRATSSISTNIAEGSAEVSKKEFMRFLIIAIRSCYETASLLCLAKQRKYLNETEFKDLYQETEGLTRQIFSFRRTLL